MIKWFATKEEADDQNNYLERLRGFYSEKKFFDDLKNHNENVHIEKLICPEAGNFFTGLSGEKIIKLSGIKNYKFIPNGITTKYFLF